MKKWLVGATLSLACLTLQTPLSGQDCYCPCDNNWNCAPLFRGLYVGGNFGFTDYRADRSDSSRFVINGTSSADDLDWTAGVQLGYDWLTCCNQVLFGLVADWNWSNAHSHLRPFSSSTGPNFRGSLINNDLDWFSTIRGRTGYACNDAVLLYITAGAAVSRISTRTKLVFSGITLDDFKFHKTRWGWTAGFGAEIGLWCRWTLNAELLYLRYRETSTSVDTLQISAVTPGFIVVPTDIQWSDQNWVGRIGLNYRFSL